MRSLAHCKIFFFAASAVPILGGVVLTAGLENLFKAVYVALKFFCNFFKTMFPPFKIDLE